MLFAFDMFTICASFSFYDNALISMNAFPKIYLNIKMSVFEAKKENIWTGFISKHDRIYVS